MTVNISNIKTSSDGAWQGDNPLNYAFPLLVVQTTLILFTSRFLAFLFKPLRQPRVVAEIIGGILLGPSALGRKKEFLQLVFPSWSTPILESLASVGLLFFLFLVGLELDVNRIRQSGKRSFGIAIAGISLPFLLGAAVSFIPRRAVHGEDKVGYWQFLMFMGVTLSITAFPVLARILAELKLLTTQVGQIAMAAAAINDVAAWILLALTVALAGNNGPGGNHHSSPLISIWVVLSGVAFVAFMMLLVRPMMNWVACRCSSPDHDFLDEDYICLTLAGVMLSGLMTDFIGIHAIFGAFVFGLTIPRGGEFATRLIRRTEDFVSGLLLPLYFASSGLKTDVPKIHGAEAWGLLVLLISTSCAGKILGTFVASMLCMIPARESLTLGVLMSTKGLVELIVLNIGKDKKVLNDEMFAILVLMALFTTFITTPTVLAIYRPSRTRQGEPKRPLPNLTDEFRIIACVHGPRNVPALVNLMESIRTTRKSLKLYVMHLVELNELSSSIMMVQKARKNGFPFVNRYRRGASVNQIAAAFEGYAQLRRIRIRHSMAISALSTMHEDIFHVAKNKRAEMIVMPFHKQWRGDSEDARENVGCGWRRVNQTVLESSPCSVALLLDRGFNDGYSKQMAESTTMMRKSVCILFFGGPDDREALNLGARMAEHPAVKVTLVRFLEENGNGEPADNRIVLEAQASRERERELDDAALAELQRRCDDGSVQYEEKVITNSITKLMTAMGQSGEYELLITGKRHELLGVRGNLADYQQEHAELGPIGDILASSNNGMVSSVLVIRKYSAHDATEDNASRMVQEKDDTTIK